MEKPIFDDLSLYRRWSNMIQRCTNPKNASYENYGGRGITVCEEWKSFRKFAYDMGYPPEGKTLDRIDNDKGYCKENCRWADWSMQNTNKRVRKDTITGKAPERRENWIKVLKAKAKESGRKAELPEDPNERKEMIRKMSNLQVKEKLKWLNQRP